MTVTGQDILADAKKHVGEQEHPLGSNSGIFVERCQHASSYGGTGWPWCAAFVDFVCKQARVALAYNSAGAHDLADHHKPWVSSDRAEPGMVVDYNIGSGHTGIVAHIDTHAGMVTSIDGNWADAVTEHSMPLREVRAFWRVPGVHYDSGVAPHPKKRRLPAWVVTTSESGHRKVVFRTTQKRDLVHWLTTHQLAKLFPHGITIHRPGRKR